MADRKTIPIIHEPLFPFAWERARLVRLILFDRSDRILCVKQGRHFDVIHGRADWDDDSLENTARREAREQVGAALDTVTIAAVLEAAEERLSDMTFELVLTAYAETMEPPCLQQKNEIAFLDKSLLLRRTPPSDRGQMKTLIEMAEVYRVKGRNANVTGSTEAAAYLVNPTNPSAA